MPLTAGKQKKQWVIKPADKRAEELAGRLRISPLLAQVLINRGITEDRTAGIFLRPKLTELIPPKQMPGVKDAVDRITKAIKSNEKITIYGDYDVDGITSVTILRQILTLLGADVDYYIPHRIDEGYGLNDQAVSSLAHNGTNLLITVDCGICANQQADLASRLGMDLIITDHHQPCRQLPPAAAIVHPALDKDYPNQDSAGAMVAFKLAWALASSFTTGKKLGPQLRDFMLNATTLAAVGTVADVMDIKGENRILTSYGLKSLTDCELCGIQALIESAGLTDKKLDSYHIGFRLAPILNAAGRMGHARLAVELLASVSRMQAMQIAEYLKQQNYQRQQCERRIFKEACEMVVARRYDQPGRKTIVLDNENWHRGVIGIVASKLVDRFYRPAIIINTPDKAGMLAKGSARSIPGFDILEAITAVSEHLVDFGGHKMAAGITIKPEKIESFADGLEDYAQQAISEQDSVAKLHIDAAVMLGQLNRQMVTELGSLEPFGQGNPRPVFATSGIHLAAAPRRVGANRSHLQLAITDNKTSVRCIGFGMGKLEKKLLENEFFNVAYHPQINTYNGADNVEFVLSDIQFE